MIAIISLDKYQGTWDSKISSLFLACLYYNTEVVQSWKYKHTKLNQMIGNLYKHVRKQTKHCLRVLGEIKV